jgi:hypothetical protein
MKKAILFLSMIAMIAGISSCKCHQCTKTNDTDLHICEKDYNSKANYDAAVATAENLGYKCRLSN